MNSFLRSFSTLFVCAFLSVACSKDGDKKSPGQNPAKPPAGFENPTPMDPTPTDPTPGNTSAGDLATLPMTKWCANGTQEDGSQVQQRFYFQYSHDFELTVFDLNPDGSRGNKKGQLNGTWQVSGNDLTVNFNGQSETLKIYVSKSDESPTGAPQLLLGETTSEMSPLDPCE